jgi:MFS family permease
MGAALRPLRHAALRPLRRMVDSPSRPMPSPCRMSEPLLPHEPQGKLEGGSGGVPTKPENEGWLPKRRLISLLMMLGFWNVYAMRVNLSSAVEPMQEKYDWDEATKGLVLSSFFWGYVPFQVVGGLIAQRVGGKVVLGAGIAVTAVLTLAIPLCASSLNALYALRALMGAGEAVTYPAANVLYTQWMPSSERAALVAFANAGSYLGTALAFPICGEVIGMAKDNSTYIDSKGMQQTGISTTWPNVFYIFGALGVCWVGAWQLLATATPEEMKGMRDDELRFVVATRGEDADAVMEKVTVAKSASPPWRAFLTHRAAWAIYINHSASNWGAYTLLTFLPDYMDTQLNFDIKSSGVLSMLPYLLMFLCSAGAGAVSDRLVRRMSVRRVRILVQCTSFWLAGATLILTGYMENSSAAVVLLTISIGISGMSAAAYNTNYIDVSPHYAGQIFSIGNTIANITGIVTPIVTGQILGDKDSASKDKWRSVFFISAGFYGFATIVWILFMSGKPVAALN